MLNVRANDSPISGLMEITNALSLTEKLECVHMLIRGDILKQAETF